MTSNEVCSRHVRHAVGEHLARTILVKISSTDFSCFPSFAPAIAGPGKTSFDGA